MLIQKLLRRPAVAAPTGCVNPNIHAFILPSSC
jgi:hypothetical protein